MKCGRKWKGDILVRNLWVMIFSEDILIWEGSSIQKSINDYIFTRVQVTRVFCALNFSRLTLNYRRISLQLITKYRKPLFKWCEFELSIKKAYAGIMNLGVNILWLHQSFEFQWIMASVKTIECYFGSNCRGEILFNRFRFINCNQCKSWSKLLYNTVGDIYWNLSYAFHHASNFYTDNCI